MIQPNQQQTWKTDELMDPLSIACPECGSVLRLRDRSKLGKRGKCPKCGNKFVLTAPASTQVTDEVKMELVDSAPATASAAPQPAIGTSARWIPDEQPAAAPLDPLPTVPATPQQSFEANAVPFDAGAPPASDGVSQLQRIQRKSSKGTRIGIAIGAVTAVLVTLAVVIAQRGDEPQGKEPPKENKKYTKEKENLKEGLATAQKKSPTKGDPIKLLYIPAGAQIVINMHPAALWEPTSHGEEVRACLGGQFNTWLEETLKKVCRFEPAEIEETLICLLAGQRGEMPEIAAVVHLKEEQKKSEMILGFAAERDDSHGRPVYLNDEHAFILVDTKTFAVGPRDEVGNMIDAMKFPVVHDPDIEELIHYTDRDRHFTIMFEPLYLRNFDDVLVPEEVRPLLHQFVDWFGEDVSTVAWSLHLAENNFHSEMLLRNGGSGVSSPRRIYKEFDKKLESLPHEVLGAVRKMNPEQLGYRRIIGRFPAMVMGYSVGTTGGIGDRYVQLTTVLPERAAPNLAVGLMLTWAESLRTDFTKKAPDLTKPKLPDLIADRLKVKVDVDFRRTPLHEAFSFIAEETKVKFDIDGDALKDKGMTQNMAQNHQLGEIPAIDAIYAIIGQYKDEGMCVVVDETKKLATVMTLKFVEQKGIKESSKVKILRPTGK